MTMCYVAKKPSKPGFYAAVVDAPDRSKDTAKTVAKFIKEGAIVLRVTVEEARAGLNEYLSAPR